MPSAILESSCPAVEESILFTKRTEYGYWCLSSSSWCTYYISVINMPLNIFRQISCMLLSSWCTYYISVINMPLNIFSQISCMLSSSWWTYYISVINMPLNIFSQISCMLLSSWCIYHISVINMPLNIFSQILCMLLSQVPRRVTHSPSLWIIPPPCGIYSSSSSKLYFQQNEQEQTLQRPSSDFFVENVHLDWFFLYTTDGYAFESISNRI